jgi:hypothetical protein
MRAMSTHHHNRDAKAGSDDRQPRRFRDTAIGSGLVAAAQIEAFEAELRLLPALAGGDPVAWDKALADLLVVRGQLTPFQAEQMLVGRRKLTLGQYRILDAIGQGGMGRVDHDLAHERDGGLHLRLWRLEDQFVMHLQQHPRIQARAHQSFVHADHGAADDVGGGALNGRIDRRAFVEGAL